MTTSKPTRLTLVSYQVGFGECFLLTFNYPNLDRHVLIDFGSTGRPTDVPGDRLKRIAEDVRTRTGGKLHAVVETHRHADHISGFATAKGTGSGDIIASLKPDLVVQPWTEDPKAKPDAKHATTTLGGRKGVVASLDAMHAVAESARNEADVLSPGITRALAAQLRFLGGKNLANRSAIENLMRMGKRHAYANYGSRSGLESILPGVTVQVLGPPTLVQSQRITRERSEDAAEFWQLQALTAATFSTNRADPLPRAESESAARGPAYTRWFRRRVQAARSEELLELVRSLDKQMNNTSVILLFAVGTKRFLFPGDAQIENWEYALSKPDARKLLRDVHLYKVGHHGSRNATPKSMWALFKNKSTTPSPRRLRSVVSTMAGKFGSLERHTEVPRVTLVDELKLESDFFTTQDLHGKTLSRVFEFAL